MAEFGLLLTAAAVAATLGRRNVSRRNVRKKYDFDSGYDTGSDSDSGYETDTSMKKSGRDKLKRKSKGNVLKTNGSGAVAVGKRRRRREMMTENRKINDQKCNIRNQAGLSKTGKKAGSRDTSILKLISKIIAKKK